MRHSLVIPDSPDFRADKSESTEGRSVAVGRWVLGAGCWGSFHYSLDEDVVAEAYTTPSQSMEELPPDVRDDIASDALEHSELIGFWVAWHLAGGFANLERGGWHRATIFRKVSRFRAAYGAHPDEYMFPWIDLDLTRRGPTSSPDASSEPARAGCPAAHRHVRAAALFWPVSRTYAACSSTPGVGLWRGRPLSLGPGRSAHSLRGPYRGLPGVGGGGETPGSV